MASRSLKTFAPLSASGLLLMLGACQAGPDYAPAPAMQRDPSAHSGWRTDLGAAKLDLGTARVATWWTTLNDPSLTTLIGRAVSGNQSVTLARLRLSESRALRRGVAADGLPQINAAGDYDRNRSSETTGQPINQSTRESGLDSYRAGFDASWELDFFGRISRNVEASDAQIAESEALLADALVTLCADVGRQYVEIRSLQERLAIISRNIQFQTDAVGLADARFNAGLTSELDVSQARTLLDTSRAAVPTLEAALEIGINRLGVLLGQDPASLHAELSAPTPVPVAGSIAAAPIGKSAEMLMRRPDLRAAERRIAAASARIGVATADLYPRISLLGSIGVSSNNFSDAFDINSRFWSIGPSLRWNVFDGGRIRANINTLEQRERQAFVSYEQAVLKAIEEAESAIVSYAKSQQRRERLATAVASSRRSVEVSELQYRAGNVGFLNVIEAQRAQLALEDNLAEADRDATTNLISVYKAVGGGWEDWKVLDASQQTQMQQPGSEPRGNVVLLAPEGAPPRQP